MTVRLRLFLLFILRNYYWVFLSMFLCGVFLGVLAFVFCILGEYIYYRLTVFCGFSFAFPRFVSVSFLFCFFLFFLRNYCVVVNIFVWCSPVVSVLFFDVLSSISVLWSLCFRRIYYYNCFLWGFICFPGF